jgi:hypothetical protein
LGFEDPTSCQNLVVKKNENNICQGSTRFEFVRVGISDGCSQEQSGGGGGVSVFFVLQEEGSDCSNKEFHVSFWGDEGRSTTNAILLSCFADDKARNWSFFVARLDDVSSGSTYNYCIEGDETIRSFQAAPSRESRNEDIISFVGDTRLPGSRAIFNHIASSESHLFIHLGDLTYGTFIRDAFCRLSRLNPAGTGNCGWKCVGTECFSSKLVTSDFLDAVRTWTKSYDETIKGKMLWMGTMGNHDNDLFWFLTSRPPVAASLPGVKQSDIDYNTKNIHRSFSASASKTIIDLQTHALEIMKTPHFYGFDFGKTHFVSLGTEDNPMNAHEAWDGNAFSEELKQRFDNHFGLKSRQYQWLEQDLAKAQMRRKEIPWLIVFTHRPIYHKASDHPMCETNGDWFGCMFRDVYEPLFKKYSVDLFLTGHSHHYSRSKPMYFKSTKVLNGVIHATIGTGGYPPTENFRGDRSWLDIKKGGIFGYAQLRVVNMTHALWTFFRVADSNTKEKLDEIWLPSKF